MSQILAFLKQTVFPGWPLYVWGLVLLLGGINEAVVRAKSTEARSLWQGLWRFVLWLPVAGALIGRFPLLGDLARRFAGSPDNPVAKPGEEITDPYRTAAPSCAACGQVLPAVAPRPPAVPPPLPPAAALLPFFALLRVLFVALIFVGTAIAVPVLAIGCANAFAYLRSTVAAMDRANGAAARLGLAKVKECGDKAVAFAREEKFDEAEVQFGLCTKLQADLTFGIKASTDATEIAAAAIDTAEAGQSKDLSGILPPLIRAGVGLKKLATDTGFQLPPIPGVN